MPWIARVDGETGEKVCGMIARLFLPVSEDWSESTELCKDLSSPRLPRSESDWGDYCKREMQIPRQRQSPVSRHVTASLVFVVLILL